MERFLLQIIMLYQSDDCARAQHWIVLMKEHLVDQMRLVISSNQIESMWITGHAAQKSVALTFLADWITVTFFEVDSPGVLWWNHVHYTFMKWCKCRLDGGWTTPNTDSRLSHDWSIMRKHGIRLADTFRLLSILNQQTPYGECFQLFWEY